MTTFEALILGVVQGATEFIPVSSSGHLIVFRELLGIAPTAGDLAFDAVLQLASILAVVIVLRAEVRAMIVAVLNFFRRRTVPRADSRLVGAVVVGTIPAIFLGLLLESEMETILRGAGPVVVGLLTGSALMFVAERVSSKQTHVPVSVGRGLLVGCYQALALIPGMSRSGATISGGLLAGFDRVDAAKFSFLLSIPIILGSGLYKLLELWFDGALAGIGAPLFVGALASFGVGYLAVGFLLSFLRRRSIAVFAWYRLALALVVAVLFI